MIRNDSSTNVWSSKIQSQYNTGILDIAHQSCPYPGIGVVMLVPIHTAQVSDRSGLQALKETYKVALPATRGCVAQEPPCMILCFPSKKSAAQVSTFHYG